MQHTADIPIQSSWPVEFNQLQTPFLRRTPVHEARWAEGEHNLAYGALDFSMHLGQVDCPVGIEAGHVTTESACDGRSQR